MRMQSIHSVLFCCNYNSIRSPMAEGIFKKLIGKNVFVQSAGVFDTREIDGFCVRVCDEINVELNKHRVRSLSEAEKNGGFVGGFDLVVPLTQEAFEEVQKYIRFCSVTVERWLIKEPLKDEQNLISTIDSYRETRDEIFRKISARFRDYLI